MPPTEAPALTTTPAVAPAPKPEVIKPLLIGSDTRPFDFLETERRLRGQEQTLPALLHKMATDTLEPLNRLANAIGIGVFVTCVYREVIRPACMEASAEAYDEKTGKFDIATFVKHFVDYFQAPSRKSSGPNLKELLLQANGISVELAQLVTLATRTPDQQNRVMQLALKLGELNQGIMKKQRKGKSPAPAAPAAPAKA